MYFEAGGEFENLMKVLEKMDPEKMARAQESLAIAMNSLSPEEAKR